MVRKDLVNRLVQALPGISKQDMHLLVDGMFEQMAEALTRDEAVDLRGFGRFKLKLRSPRQARNPRTGASVDLPQRRVIHFRPSQRLTDLVNAASPPDSSVSEGS